MKYSSSNIITFKMVEAFKCTYDISKEKIIERRQNKKEWINIELIELCKQKDVLYKRWKANPNNIEYMNEYKKINNYATKKINQTKNEFYKNKIIECHKDPKKTWLVVNDLLGRKSSNIDDVIIKNMPGMSPINIANKMAASFSENVKKICHECNYEFLLC